jgi:hypothetical protein
MTSASFGAPGCRIDRVDAGTATSARGFEIAIAAVEKAATR